MTEKCIICHEESTKDYQCVLCGLVFYCSEECFKKHSSHKSFCNIAISQLKGLYAGDNKSIRLKGFQVKKVEEGYDFIPEIKEFPIQIIMSFVTLRDGSEYDCQIATQILIWTLFGIKYQLFKYFVRDLPFNFKLVVNQSILSAFPPQYLEKTPISETPYFQIANFCMNRPTNSGENIEGWIASYLTFPIFVTWYRLMQSEAEIMGLVTTRHIGIHFIITPDRNNFGERLAIWPSGEKKGYLIGTLNELKEDLICNFQHDLELNHELHDKLNICTQIFNLSGYIDPWIPVESADDQYILKI